MVAGLAGASVTGGKECSSERNGQVKGKHTLPPVAEWWICEDASQSTMRDGQKGVIHVTHH
jgi:hypothetical protein